MVGGCQDFSSIDGVIGNCFIIYFSFPVYSLDDPCFFNRLFSSIDGSISNSVLLLFLFVFIFLLVLVLVNFVSIKKSKIQSATLSQITRKLFVLYCAKCYNFVILLFYF